MQKKTLKFCEQVKQTGNKFLNNVEISAQEAVYQILQIHLYKSTREVQFINWLPDIRRVIEVIRDVDADNLCNLVLALIDGEPGLVFDLCENAELPGTSQGPTLHIPNSQGPTHTFRTVRDQPHQSL